MLDIINHVGHRGLVTDFLIEYYHLGALSDNLVIGAHNFELHINLCQKWKLEEILKQ